MDFSPV